MQLGINSVCQLSHFQKWRLKYRASRDGFSAESFQAKCDGVPNTLTVIKSSSGNIFGGFAKKMWDLWSSCGKSCGYEACEEYGLCEDKSALVFRDPDAYIFSLVNKEKVPFKALCSSDGENALYCSPSSGPSFGFNPVCGCDIQISSDSDVRQSLANFGYTFKHPDFVEGTERAQSILAGTRLFFQTIDIEVFAKVC